MPVISQLSLDESSRSILSIILAVRIKLKAPHWKCGQAYPAAEILLSLTIRNALLSKPLMPRDPWNQRGLPATLAGHPTMAKLKGDAYFAPFFLAALFLADRNFSMEAMVLARLSGVHVARGRLFTTGASDTGVAGSAAAAFTGVSGSCVGSTTVIRITSSSSIGLPDNVSWAFSSKRRPSFLVARDCSSASMSLRSSSIATFKLLICISYGNCRFLPGLRRGLS